jgi:trehalose/maltose hydrolase-like predicted phosphorylase
VFPTFNLRLPEVTRTLLLYRFYRLDAARDRAKQLGYFGACYPWQSSSTGKEETQEVHYNPMNKTWGPDYSSNQLHVNIAIFFNSTQPTISSHSPSLRAVSGLRD